MTPIPFREARRQASLVKSATMVGDARVTPPGGIRPERYITIMPAAGFADDPEAASKQLAEIVAKLKPLGWVQIREDGMFGRPVESR